MDKKMSKKAQINIFIIAGIILFVAFAIFVIMRQELIPGISWKSYEENPTSFLESCLGNQIRDTVEIISLQGGSINNPLSKKFKFEGDKEYYNISYLCYNQNYYYPCINQEPMLFFHLKKEMKNYLSEGVKSCFNDLIANYKKNYEVESSYNGFEVELVPGKVVIKIDASISVVKSGESVRYENFKVGKASKFYEISAVVQEIVSQEARFCNFESMGYMLIYREFNIDKFRTGDLSTIYTVESRESKEKFRFAVRGCVIPPGI